MAIKLIANYSKRLGLPGYSSHQFSVSVETDPPSNAAPADGSGISELLPRSPASLLLPTWNTFRIILYQVEDFVADQIQKGIGSQEAILNGRNPVCRCAPL